MFAGIYYPDGSLHAAVSPPASFGTVTASTFPI
jgi:hypothetical protein